MIFRAQIGKTANDPSLLLFTCRMPSIALEIVTYCASFSVLESEGVEELKVHKSTLTTVIILKIIN
ncbi:hypothetical protein MATR_03480 [Marivirga tractuosa]|uniref:Uncharacterized protein n=1 Tax=Marivirga tractuosa (strain ATCC 23168 / DSM 4126 / NBRC 15989 / NCIMB 1408 / VKM B-1430 / H-43) TaxID=643867 RepID=E4TTW3_MARTH|nr:hypothetical protein Ftrac_2033 [Marivirga tractuosa DSM 4126]BDD13523.1 hypothetical protein MATR_03480 [Marivirga tractuosa]